MHATCVLDLCLSHASGKPEYVTAHQLRISKAAPQNSKASASKQWLWSAWLACFKFNMVMYVSTASEIHLSQKDFTEIVSGLTGRFVECALRCAHILCTVQLEHCRCCKTIPLNLSCKHCNRQLSHFRPSCFDSQLPHFQKCLGHCHVVWCGDLQSS